MLGGTVKGEGILRDSVLVVGIDEELSTNTAAAALGVLADLQVLQEPVVNELRLHCREGEKEGGRGEGEVNYYIIIEGWTHRLHSS